MQPKSLIGTILDERYAVISSIGEGGMGQVYQAREIQLDRIVAIKVLHPLAADEPQASMRFEREARVMSDLNHANIVGFLRFGIWQEQPYIVMEYVPGTTLKEVINQGKLGWRRALSVAIEICDAVAAAHAQGIVHRDLKPANVALLQVDGHDFVKVMDFGLSGLLPACQVPAQKLTQTGNLIGSLQYLSPEQAIGAKVDHRTDIYALGCIIYECITGVPPFDGDSPVQLLYKHVHDPVPDLADVCPDDSRPVALDAVLSRSMAKDLQDRYQSMVELKEDIEALLRDKPMAKEDGQATLPRRSRRKIKPVALPMALAIVAIITMVGYATLPLCLRALLFAPPAANWMDRGLSWSNQLAKIGSIDGAAFILRSLAQIARERHDLLSQAQSTAAWSLLIKTSDQSESRLLAAQALTLLLRYVDGDPALVLQREMPVAALVAQAVLEHSESYTFENVETLEKLAHRYNPNAVVCLSFTQAATDLAKRIFSSSDVRRPIQETRLAMALTAAGRREQAANTLNKAAQAHSKIRSVTDRATLDMCLVSGWAILGDESAAMSYLNDLLTIAPYNGLAGNKRNPDAVFGLINGHKALKQKLLEDPRTMQHSPFMVKEFAQYLADHGEERQSVQLCQRLLDDHDSSAQVRIEAALVQASSHFRLSEWEAMLKSADLALAIAEQYPPYMDREDNNVLGRNSGITLDCQVMALICKAQAQSALGRQAQADATFERALRLSLTGLPMLSVHVYSAMGEHHIAYKRGFEAESAARAAIEKIKVHRLQPYVLADEYEHLAHALLMQGKFKAAEVIENECKSLLPKLIPTQQLGITHLWYIRHYQMGNDRQRRLAAAEGVKIVRTCNLSGMYAYQSLYNLAESCIVDGDLKQALSILQQLTSDYQDNTSIPYGLRLHVQQMLRLALTQLKIKDPSAWRQLEAESIRSRKQAHTVPCSIEDDANGLSELAIIARRLGKTAQADRLREQAMSMTEKYPVARRLVLDNERSYLFQAELVQQALLAGRQVRDLSIRNKMAPELIIQDTVALAQALSFYGSPKEALTMLQDLLRQQESFLAHNGIIRLGIQRQIDTVSARIKK